MAESTYLLIGCGILKREIRQLIDKNGWPLDTLFLDSSLHVDFERLARSLSAALEQSRGREVIVFYGCCHPLMDSILARHSALRTEGQNCVDMLLGHELFSQELAAGAFFLLEDWAQRWEEVVTASFGTKKWELIAEMFQGDRKYLLGITTPCSGDFRAAAENAGRLVGLPVRWKHAPLENLETVLKQALARKAGERLCPR